jgi:hypothetical protein
MRRLLLLGILLVGLLLVSCESGFSDIPLTNEEFWTGTKGLEFHFVDGNPPEEIFEDMLFSVALEIENQGAHTLTGFLTLSTEDDYMTLIDPNDGEACDDFDPEDEYSATLRNEIEALYTQIETYTETLQELDDEEEEQRLKDLIHDLREEIEAKKDASPTSNECKTRWFSLEGKSVFNYNGGTDVEEYQARAKSAGRLSETHDVQVIATACYQYTTLWNQEVCIDTDINKMNIFEGACEASDISLTSQGAPIAITKIESTMLPTGTGYIRPMFKIYLDNKGNGNVINKEKTEHACTSTGLGSKDYNLVFLKRFMLSNEDLVYDFNGLDATSYKEINANGDGDTITCSPNPITLDNDGKDYVTCIVNEDLEWDMFSLEQAPYSATISMQFDYGYTLSKSVPLTIEKIII